MFAGRNFQLALLAFVCLGQDFVIGQQDASSAQKFSAALRLRVSYQGEPPPVAYLDANSDAICKQHKVPNERLLVGRDGSLQNVLLIWDEAKNREIAPKSYAAPASQQVDVKVEHCRIQPHIVFARVGQKLVISSPDQTAHNLNIGFFNNHPSGALRPAGATWTQPLTVSEPSVLIVECGVHAWERGYLVVKEHSFVGLANDGGFIEIKDLPIGKNWFRIWHESIGREFDHIVWNGTKTQTPRGRIEFSLSAGMNDLGAIALTADQFRARDEDGTKN